MCDPEYHHSVRLSIGQPVKKSGWFFILVFFQIKIYLRHEERERWCSGDKSEVNTIRAAVHEKVVCIGTSGRNKQGAQIGREKFWKHRKFVVFHGRHQEFYPSPLLLFENPGLSPLPMKVLCARKFLLPLSIHMHGKVMTFFSAHGHHMPSRAGWREEADWLSDCRRRALLHHPWDYGLVWLSAGQ